MPRLLVLAVVLGGGYLYLAQTNPQMLRQMHLSGGSGGGALNPVMGGMASGVGVGAIKAAGGIGG